MSNEILRKLIAPSSGQSRAALFSDLFTGGDFKSKLSGLFGPPGSGKQPASPVAAPVAAPTPAPGTAPAPIQELARNNPSLARPRARAGAAASRGAGPGGPGGF